MRRTAVWAVVCAVVLAVTAAVAIAGTVDMKPGEWSITSKTKIEGMPMSPPPVTVKQCLTEEDLVPQSSGGQQGQSPDCEIKDQKISGNTVSWSIVCNDPQAGKMTGTGSVTYAGTTFSGKSTMTMSMAGQTMKVHTDLSGKWLGACKK
jgi:hypothetical protein